MAAVDDLLAEARAGLERVGPEEARRLVEAGEAFLVDIRPVEQRQRDGELPGATVIPRNVLEWRLDPSSEHRSRALEDPDRLVIVACDEGYQSSLAAWLLQRLGRRATDLDGGVQGWLARGLSVETRKT